MAYKTSLGGNLPENLDVLVVSYRYNCDTAYGNCQDREEYTVSKRYGLVQWDHAKLNGSGKYVQDKATGL